MKILCIILLFFCSLASIGQVDMVTPFKNCDLLGSCTIYKYNQKQWLFSDSTDAAKASLPASTFKIINLLIALETGVIRDENEMIKWPGQTDTTRYGYRPEIYHNMNTKEAFEVSAVWVFLDLAAKVGRERYSHFLQLCNYGNADLSEQNQDFWNMGALAISPRNQVEFLIRLYENRLPFSTRNMEIVKRVMISEQNDSFTLHAKTGWTREGGTDSGWWVGYVEKKENIWFFATRISKPRSTLNSNFSSCRKEITKAILRQLKAMP